MKTVATLAVLSAACLLSGCSQSLSPKMAGLAYTKGEAKMSRRVAYNQNYRSISDDWHRAWYSDHPSRLSPYPVMYTSGQPR